MQVHTAQGIKMTGLHGMVAPARGESACDFTTAWSTLPYVEQAILELAWEACTAGTVGVGAAIVDEHGDIIALARNTTRGVGSAAMPLSGCYVAHAEVNAIAQIPTDRSLGRCTLLTTLLPCVMCAGAMVMSHVGHVRYLAPDPVFRDIERLADIAPFIRDQWPVYDAGPADEWAVVALLLGGYAKAVLKPTGAVMASYEHSEPEVAHLLRRAATTSALTANSLPLSALLAQMWGDIVTAAATRSARHMLDVR